MRSLGALVNLEKLQISYTEQEQQTSSLVLPDSSGHPLMNVPTKHGNLVPQQQWLCYDSVRSRKLTPKSVATPIRHVQETRAMYRLYCTHRSCTMKAETVVHEGN